ncbi:sulfurtransferase [Pasteurellaceae bacterium Macca]|nr:sulfurtransferase [Pasteurellaceae bacterium Macca]
MKKYRLALLFTQPPFGSSQSREGLDALLAASAFCDEEEIAICFLNDGVFNLLPDQQPEAILQKDHIATFKLIELYELRECFVCQDSLLARGLNDTPLLLSDIILCPQAEIFNVLNRADKILTF